MMYIFIHLFHLSERIGYLKQVASIEGAASWSLTMTGSIICPMVYSIIIDHCYSREIVL